MYGGLGMGSYGGMGGMYGGGMYGVMGMGMPGMEQSPNLMNSMIALQSLGFLVNSLSEIARSLDQNYEGLQLFKESFSSNSSVMQILLPRSKEESKEVLLESDINRNQHFSG